MSTDVLLGIGLAAHLPCDAPLPLADQHPLLHPGFQLLVSVADDVVVRADPRVGLMHRSAEKLFEVRDYRQAMLLANRHDWLSPFTSEVGVALAIEEALGLVPPERATWIRTLLVEVNRIIAALAFLAPVAGATRAEADLLRERCVDVQARITGSRVHPGFARIGGVAAPMEDGDLTTLLATLDAVEAAVPSLRDVLAELQPTLSGVARLTREQAIDLGVGGCVGRASGWDLDLRRDDPHLAYGQLRDELQVVTAEDGDAAARYAVLLEQVPGSVRLARSCIDALRRLGDGPVDVPLPKVVRLPEGMTYSWLDGPLGISGCLIVSTGEKTPWRMKVRSASFATMPAMAVALAGTPMDRVAQAVMSFPMVIGDVDR